MKILDVIFGRQEVFNRVQRRFGKLEVFGHRLHYGWVSVVEELGGKKVLVEERVGTMGGIERKYYHPNSVFCWTPIEKRGEDWRVGTPTDDVSDWDCVPDDDIPY